MPLTLSTQHPTWEMKATIQEACDSFFNYTGLSYFQYLRCYDDGSIGLLTNNTSLIDYLPQIDKQPIVFSSITNEQEKKHAYWFLWDEVLPKEPVSIAREKFNIRHGLTLVRRSKHYYDMIAVALPFDPENTGTFYLNKLKAIEQFIGVFDKNNKHLINVMDKNPIALPPPYRDQNYNKICLKAGRIEVVGKMNNTYITERELACLRLYAHSKSYKEIAAELDISPRTVETYLQRVKLRTGYSSQSELETLLLM